MLDAFPTLSIRCAVESRLDPNVQNFPTSSIIKTPENFPTNSQWDILKSKRDHSIFLNIRSALLTRCWIILIGGVLCSGLLWPGAAHAGQPIRIRANEYTFAFGQYVQFHLEAAGDAPIQSVILAYRTWDTQGTTVQTIEFDPNTSIALDYVHDITGRYVRPFVQITYWWTIKDAVGNKIVTEPQTFVYVDNRFDWETLSENGVSIHWYRGEIEIAQQALNAAILGSKQARQDIPVTDQNALTDIYLYAGSDDLRIALPSLMPEGTEALTLHETNVILVAFAPQAANIPNLRRILPHEITHVLLYHFTQNDFARVPMWLNEGLATSVQHTFAPDPKARQLLDDAVRQEQTIALNTLCAAFPTDLARANLAYAQSASVIDFIRNIYGRQTLHDLIAAYADGTTCEGGVQRVLNRSLDGLEQQWLDSLAPRSAWAIFWDQNGAWAIIVFLFALLPFLFIIPARVQGMNTK